MLIRILPDSEKVQDTTANYAPEYTKTFMQPSVTCPSQQHKVVSGSETTLLFEEAWESIHYPTPPRGKKRETIMYNLTQKRQGWPTQGAAMVVESDSYQKLSQ